MVLPVDTSFSRTVKLMTRNSIYATVLLGLIAVLVGWLTAVTLDDSPAFGQDKSIVNATFEQLDRTILPIPEPKLTPITILDARETKAPARFEIKAPAGAPNVLIVLIDDKNVFINVKNRSHTITADVEIPKGGANGVILAQAGRFGGWSLYLKDSKPINAYNFLGLKTTKIGGSEALPVGNATIRFDLDYNGPGVGKGGTVKILVNGKQVATGKIERTQGNFFSADEGADVGQDGETPVSDDYKEGQNKFTGKIKKVVIEVGPVTLAAADKEDLRKTTIALMTAE